MRHQLTLILTAVLMLMASCSRDFDAVDTPAPVAEETADEGYVVSVEQALTSLDNELAMIYGADETRAAQPRRRVKTIHNVAYDRVAPVTRSTDAPDDVADLFYIVEFADGQGSAVLGADKRVEPVVAILDETVLTPEDFASADIESDDITSYMAALMVNGAIDSGLTIKDSNDWSKPLPIDKFWGPGHDTVIVNKQAPMLNTKWHQNSPYNEMCPADFDAYGILRHCPAGCGPVAIGQILLYNYFPIYTTIDGDTFDRDLLNRCNTGLTPSFAAQMEVARFIYKIGVYVGTDYDNECITYDQNVPALLRHVGYRSVALQYFDLDKARAMVCDNKLPLYMSGKNANAVDGHIWVVDGWNEYSVRDWNCYYDTHGGTYTTILDRVLLSSTRYIKIHCNFGWGGKSDGYYSYNLFNTTKRLGADDIDPSVGDIDEVYDSTSTNIFNSDFNMITYSLLISLNQ